MSSTHDIPNVGPDDPIEKLEDTPEYAEATRVVSLDEFRRRAPERMRRRAEAIERLLAHARSLNW